MGNLLILALVRRILLTAVQNMCTVECCIYVTINQAKDKWMETSIRWEIEEREYPLTKHLGN